MHKAMILILTALLIAACTTQPPAIDNTASQDEMTYDGLYPVNNTVVKLAWARRDIDLTGYNKVLLQGAGIQYRPVKASASNRFSSASVFPLNEKQKTRLRDEVQESFLEEIQKGANYAIVTEPGPDVLIVRGGLLDVVSFVPPQRVGRSDVYLDRVGEATMVIELADSQSEAVLARIVDRRAAAQQGMAMEATPVSNAAEVRRMVRFWATRLRENLDKLSTNLDIGIAP